MWLFLTILILFIENQKQSGNEIEIAASTAFRYSDSPKDDLSNVRVRIGQKEIKELRVFPIDDKILNKLRI